MGVLKQNLGSAQKRAGKIREKSEKDKSKNPNQAFMQQTRK
jgi:hypothetical protein